MVLQAPKLDDRTYADLLAEAKSRIPRYAPEWTDLNDTDPGMALVQLFAWMSEALLFRIGRVPELNYVKFLQLLGIQQSPATPARTWLAFPLADNQPNAVVPIPRLTQVAAADDADVIFETMESINATALRVACLANVTETNGSPNAPTPLTLPLMATPFQIPPPASGYFAVCLDYPEKFPGPRTIIPSTQLSLTFISDVAQPSSSTISCGVSQTVQGPSIRIVWEFYSGQIGATGWQTLAVDRDTTCGLTQTGQILFRAPQDGKWTRGAFGTFDGFWLRPRLVAGSYEANRHPRLLAVCTNTVPAIQAQTHQREQLGRSSGQPNQLFRLAFNPVVDGTLQLKVDEGLDAPVTWLEVPDFLGSGPNDSHYVLDRTIGEIRFGNGEAGRIPVATDSGDGIVALHYRHGGGRRGNLAAGSIRQLLSVLSGVDDAKIQNPVESVGGRDTETLEQAMSRAPQELKNKDRAVTAADYEQLAMSVPGVARARALALAHPRFPCQPVPGAVTVVVVPDSELPAPVASEPLLRSVCEWLEPRRVLTAEVFVRGAEYTEVSAEVELVVNGAADAAEVARAVELQLLRYFHPLTGGESGKGWDFGGTIYYSLVYRQILAVPGVQRIGSLRITLQSAGEVKVQPACADIPLQAGHLASSTHHNVVAIYSGA